jgi:hypothetical protein
LFQDVLILLLLCWFRFEGPYKCPHAYRNYTLDVASIEADRVNDEGELDQNEVDVVFGCAEAHKQEQDFP